MKKSRLLGAVCACLFALIATSTHAAILPLESRLGGLAYYDPNLNITWATDASMSGFMDWDTADTWSTSLVLGGVSGWRLPSASVDGDNHIADCATGLGDDCSDNEMAYLFHVEGINSSDSSPFNIPFNPNSGIFFWTSTLLFTINGFDPNKIWDFSFTNAGQGVALKDADDYAWAVHDGDVGAVPIPAAVWLFGSGLLGLIGIAKRKRMNNET